MDGLRFYITGAVAVSLRLATPLFERVRDARQRRQDARRLHSRLFAEVDFNTTDMECFLLRSAALPRIRQAVPEDPKLIPHITDARHSVSPARDCAAILYPRPEPTTEWPGLTGPCRADEALAPNRSRVPGQTGR